MAIEIKSNGGTGSKARKSVTSGLPIKGRRQKFPRKSGPLDAFRNWLLSNNFRVPLQVAIGVLVGSLFTFIRQIVFPEACLAGILVLVSLVLLSPHPNLGCQLRANAAVLCVAVWIPTYAGCIASLARTPGSAYTGTLYTFIIVGLIPLAAIRVYNQPVGIMSLVIYGVLATNVVKVYPVHLIWRAGVAYIMAAMCLSAAALIVSASLVFTQLAGDGTRSCASSALRDMGQQLSLYSATLLADNGGAHLSQPAAEKASADATKALQEEMMIPEELKKKSEFLAALQDRTDPNKKHGQEPLSMKIAPPIASIRAKLELAKQHLMEAEYEPPCLQNGPQNTADWGRLLADCQGTLTRLSVMRLLTEGGHLFDSKLLSNTIGFDPLPAFRVIFAELAIACKSLSEAIAHAGKPEVASMLTDTDWQEMLIRLANFISQAQQGYWAKQKEKGSRDANEALEVRVLLFLATVTIGIIEGMSGLEKSIPVALGYEAKDLTRQSILTPKLQNTSIKENTERGLPQQVHIEMASPADGAFSGHEGAEGNGTSVSSTAKDKAVQDISAAEEVQINIAQGSAYKKYKRGFLRSHFDFASHMAVTILGIPVGKLLYQVFIKEVMRTCSSRKEFVASLKSRKAQYGFKVWLALSIALAIVFPVTANFPKTAEWRLYYGLITVSIIMIERVEAAAWKVMQRIVGTFLGGTLGYLIMLRVPIHSRGVVVIALICTSLFVILQGLHSSFTYTFLLSCITLLSLTLCQHPQCCRHNSDWLIWKARVVDIIIGCFLAMAVSWLILPWYTSDEHLSFLGDAFTSAGKLVENMYTTFYEACQSEKMSKQEYKEKMQKIKAQFEAEVVRPVEAVILGLNKDTVYWQKGLLSTPPVVTRLTAEMGSLIRKMQALGMSVRQTPEELGEFTEAVHTHALVPLHAESSRLFCLLRELSAACEDLLKFGSRADRETRIQGFIERVEEARTQCQASMCHLMSTLDQNAAETGKHALGSFSSADLTRFTSYRLSCSKVSDQMMLIAKLLLTEECKRRDGWWSSLISLHGHKS